MGIKVDSIRACATVVAWALSSRWAQKYGYFPFLVGPRSEGDASPICLFEEISRYKVLFLGHIRLSMDKLVDDLMGADFEFGDEDEY